MSLEERAKAAAKNIEGKVEETLGKIVGDPETQAKGKAKQVEAAARNTVENVKDKAKGLADAVKDKAKEIRDAIK
jgi:uncharacterized protein YjbJ (UPF0337 family)